MTAGTFISLQKGRLHRYRQAGELGPMAVFLHGYTDSGRSFDGLFPTLGPTLRLLTLDQRGHGKTDAGQSYAIADFAEDAIRFIEIVAREPVHLVGHSLGSIVAQRVAEARPDLVTSLTLIGAARSAAGHPALRDLRVALSLLGENIHHKFVRDFQAGTTHVPLPPDLLDRFVSDSLSVKPDTWRKTLDGLIDEPIPDNTITIDVPTLLLWGAKDTLFDAGTQSELAECFSDLTAVTYADVGHAPHWECPDAAAQDMLDFINRIRRRGGAGKAAEYD